MKRKACWARLCVLFLLSGCHGHEHGPGADHPHGHGGTDEGEDPRPDLSLTHFTDKTELFVELPALVVGQPSKLAAHLTRLDDWRPVGEGRCVVILAGGGAPEERFEVDRPRAAGIFGPVARPVHAATRELAVVLETAGVSDRHELGSFTVHRTVEAAVRAAPEEPEEQEEPAAIPFLKEQQWQTEFATMPVGNRSFRGAVLANGSVRARSEGEARITAPVPGRLVTAGPAFPRIGQDVAEDEVLAGVTPRLDDSTDVASLRLAVTQAELELERARRERERLEALLIEHAVPERRVVDARYAESSADAAVRAARQRLGQHAGMQRSGGRGGAGRVSVRSPVAGTIVDVETTPGTFLEDGAALFHVVDLDRLWLEARIPEADVGKVQTATGAWFEVEGFDRPFEVDAPAGSSVVAFGGVVDPDSRTVPLIFDIPNPGRVLRVGMFARVRVLTGQAVTGVAVPRSAIVDDRGQEVVYVLLGGESFARRPVRVGVRDGDWVQVLDGVRAGERVVSKGAYQVRLASSGSAAPAHGHVH